MRWSQPTALLWQQLIFHLIDEHRVFNLKEKRWGEPSSDETQSDFVGYLSTSLCLSSSLEIKELGVSNFVLLEKPKQKHYIILSDVGLMKQHVVYLALVSTVIEPTIPS